MTPFPGAPTMPAAPLRPLRIGTRGSRLALRQSTLVADQFRAGGHDVELVTLVTSGDVRPPDTAWGEGAFVGALEQALLDGEIDLAVHSAKDLPSDAVAGLGVRATLPRAATEDVLITKGAAGLRNLPKGSVIATGSVRRQRQLGWIRPDLEIVDLRGNVPTRLRKLRQNTSWSGIILARAGLERLGLVEEGEILSPQDFVPAGGQGVIALQVRRDDARVRELIDAVNDRETQVCLRAEREFLRLLDGDCDSPVGVQAKVEADKIRIHAQVFEAPGAPPRVGTEVGPSDDPEAIAEQLMKKLYGG